MLDTLNASQNNMPPWRMYIAKVVDNKDPDMLQRIKVTIPDLMTGAPETLPWLLPVTYPAFGGTTTEYMTVNVPHIGDVVVVVFQDADLSYGMYIGSVPIGGQQIGPLAENYPNRYGFRDPANNHLYVDTTDGKTDVEFRHNSGTVLHVDNAGNVTVHVVANRDTTIDLDDKRLVKGNSSKRVEGNVDETILGNETLHTEKKRQRAVNGTETVTIHEKGLYNYHADYQKMITGSSFTQINRNESRNTLGTKREVVSDAVTVGWNNGATVTITGIANINVNGNANVNVTGWITSRAAMWMHRGPVEIQGNVTITQHLQVYQTARVTGTLTVFGDGWFGSKLNVVVSVNTFRVDGAEVIASNAISLRLHKHGNGNNGRPTSWPF